MEQRGKPDHAGCNRRGKRVSVSHSSGQQQPPHARRKSSAAPANSPDEARTAQQVTGDASRDSEQHTIDYERPSGAPTPIPTPTSGQTPIMAPSTPAAPVSPQDYTDDDIKVDICQFMREEIDPGGQEAAESFQQADENPPITPESLAELDMPRIINNPKLRHDVNFDRELHFRPNLDGSKGKQKIHQADQYWIALEAELFIHNFALVRRAQFPDNEVYWSRIGKAALVRLPKIFAAIRDILRTLVPDYDQKAVRDRLDVDHIMQEIRNGVCDLIDLAKWLSKVLKNHCAPMRDVLVDSMRKEITHGALKNDQVKLVNGLRQLMNILEAMKLDVANHQIRHMRPLLVDDTINFQRRYNAHRIQIGKISTADAKAWILDNMQPHGCEPTALLAVSRGLIYDLLYNDTATYCPPTFYLDSDRLRLLRNELHGRIYHAICRDALREIAIHSMSDVEVHRACDTLTLSIAAIVGPQGKFADKTENIAAEVVRVLLTAEDRQQPIDADLVTLVEQKLRNSLRQDCHEFRQHAIALADRLIPKLQMYVRDHLRLSAVELQDILVPQPVQQKSTQVGFGAHCEPVASGPDRLIDPDYDIIRRFTHIVALHWHVWADLVYLAETPDKDEDSLSEYGSDSTMVQSRTGSPTVPIATAVYAPGRRWLPISVTVTDVPTGLPTPSPSPKPEDGNSGNNTEQTDESFDSQKQPA